MGRILASPICFLSPYTCQTQQPLLLHKSRILSRTASFRLPYRQRLRKYTSYLHDHVAPGVPSVEDLASGQAPSSGQDEEGSGPAVVVVLAFVPSLNCVLADSFLFCSTRSQSPTAVFFFKILGHHPNKQSPPTFERLLAARPICSSSICTSSEPSFYQTQELPSFPTLSSGHRIDLDQPFPTWRLHLSSRAVQAQTPSRIPCRFRLHKGESGRPPRQPHLVVPASRRGALAFLPTVAIQVPTSSMRYLLLFPS